MHRSLISSLSGTVLTAAVLAATALPRPVLAQRVLDVGPVLGAYLPMGTFGHPNETSTPPSSPSELRGQAWGGSARAWFNESWGVQLQGMGTSRVVGNGVITPGGFNVPPETARVIGVNGEAVYRPNVAFKPWWIGAGLGVVNHGGEAYDHPHIEGRTSAAFTAGTGLDWRIGHSVLARIGATTWLYSLDVHSGPGAYLERGFQADVIPFISVAWESAAF